MQNDIPANFYSEGGTIYNANPNSANGVSIGVVVKFKGLTADKVAALVPKEVG